jgi:uncharacterized membrane protein
MRDRPLIATIRNRLITGLIAILPAALTVWVLITVVRLTDGIFQPIFRLLFDRTFPGFGLILTPILLYLIGLVVQHQISGKMVRWGESLVHRVPVVGSIYSAVKQTLDAFDFSSTEQKFSRVVFVEYPKRGSWSLGFVTRDVDFLNEKSLCLFIPTTPNPTSGVLIVAPEKETVATSMTLEEAAKFVVSAGLVIPTDMALQPGSAAEPVLARGFGD